MADNEDDAGYIKLIGFVKPTVEERNDVKYVPKLEVNEEATEIIRERFESPISILVYAGSMGVGKSKLASLTVATLQDKKYNMPLYPFRSGHNVQNVTDGIWMWRTPLKSLNQSNKKGSILLLDCEGMNQLNENRNANVYLFCMIISTAFAVILRPPRANFQQWEYLYNALLRFKQMKTPCVLPKLWLVPLELPHLTDNNKTISSSEWVKKVFSLNESADMLSIAEYEKLRERYNFIQEMLPNIDVANICSLPGEFLNDKLKCNELFTLLRTTSSEDYYKCLCTTIDRFLGSRGKRLPGTSSVPLFVRPAELAQLIIDLIDVTNTDSMPNPDQVIGKYLLTRFDDEIVKQKQIGFEQALLSYADRYVKEHIKGKQTEREKEESKNKLNEERDRLMKHYISVMRRLAETKIYGYNSILLESEAFQEKLIKAKENMSHYREPDTFMEAVQNVFDTGIPNEQESLSTETREKLNKLLDRILREEHINDSIDPETQRELQVELEQCPKCHRPAGTVNLVHAKEDCDSGRNGNYYRYNYVKDQMVCDACRKLTKITATDVKCTRCGALRRMKQIH